MCVDLLLKFTERFIHKWECLPQSVALDRSRRVLRKQHVVSSSSVKRWNRKGWNGFWSCNSFWTDLGMKVYGKSYCKEPGDLRCLPRVTLLPWMSFTSLWGLNVTKTSGEVDCHPNPHYFSPFRNCLQMKSMLVNKPNNWCSFNWIVIELRVFDAFGSLTEYISDSLRFQHWLSMLSLTASL